MMHATPVSMSDAHTHRRLRSYPERLGATLIYPVPKVVATLVNGAISFLPRRTREKFALLSNEEQLCTRAGLNVEELPKGFADL